jgi:hypothetical protein
MFHICIIVREQTCLIESLIGCADDRKGRLLSLEGFDFDMLDLPAASVDRELECTAQEGIL